MNKKFGGLSLVVLAVLPYGSCFADLQYADVVSVKPLYDQVEIPHLYEHCVYNMINGNVIKKCEQQNSFTYENRVVSYDIEYNYAGKKYNTNNSYDPGSKLIVESSSFQ